MDRRGLVVDDSTNLEKGGELQAQAGDCAAADYPASSGGGLTKLKFKLTGMDAFVDLEAQLRRDLNKVAPRARRQFDRANVKKFDVLIEQI